MKTLQEIYTEVLANEELQARFVALNTPEQKVIFVKELGGEATAVEIEALLAERNGEEGELSDTELAQVAGGKDKNEMEGEVIGWHSKCDKEIMVEYDEKGKVYRCNGCGEWHFNRNEFDYIPF